MSKMQLLRKVDEWKAIESERDKFIEVRVLMRAKEQAN